ncbi:right-handed parallel beta-helix repeat-containing protein, partial [Candidatus Bathyarchaeota archaeon]
NCEIRNFRPRPEQTDLFNNGFAIWVVGYSEVVIEENYIHDYGWMGIVVDGITNGETVTIIDNTIKGWGPTIQTGQNGIQVSRGAHVKILSNTIKNNVYTGENWWASGIIFLDAMGEVTGNLISDNQVGVDGMGDVTAICINFNNIYGNILAGVYNEGADTLNATYNWWGDPEGPTVEASPKSGDAVYGNIEFTPWLTAPLMPDPDGTGVVASSQSGEDKMLEYPGSNVEVFVSGSATVYVATYESNPGASFMGDISNYIDVYVPDISGLSELEIRKYYTDEEIEALGLVEHSLRLYWWNGANWIQCSDTGVNTADNYIWARIGIDTTPSLTDLGGTPFGAAGRIPVGGVVLPIDNLYLIVWWLLITTIIIMGTLIIIRKKHL